MSFTMLGFSQANNVRQFVFERRAADRSRVPNRVDADLVALRGFRIRLQELPLTCRRLLEALPEGDGSRALTLTDEDMRQHATATTARDVPKRTTSFSGTPEQAMPFGEISRSPAPGQLPRSLATATGCQIR
jgi:hypothetical protein